MAGMRPTFAGSNIKHRVGDLIEWSRRRRRPIAFAAGGCGFFLTATAGVPGQQADPPRPDWPVQAVPREQETPAQAQPAPRFCGRRLLCRGGSSCLGANRGDTVGLGIDGEEEEPCTNVAAARLRKARMILFPAVRITAREAGTMI